MEEDHQELIDLLTEVDLMKDIPEEVNLLLDIHHQNMVEFNLVI